MASEDDTTTGIIIPGPELRAKIEKSAASLAKRDKRKAEEMIAKVLASQKREEFLFFEMTHVFYPFFLQKMNEFRAHPELIPSEEKRDSSGKVLSSTAGGGGEGNNNNNNNITTINKAGGIVRREGGTATRNDPKREDALRQAEVEAQRYLEDPFPNKYSLDLLHGTLDMPALTMNYMTCTAQYVAKYGEPFLKGIMSRYRNNPEFRFLNSEDVRHEVMMKLVESYRNILHHDPEEVEDRLERYQSAQNILDIICEEKAKYIKAAIARRKAALLTDEALRDKLEWNVFTVVQQFSLSDLGLDGPMPEAAAARRRAHLDSNNSKSNINSTTNTINTTNINNNDNQNNENRNNTNDNNVVSSKSEIDTYTNIPRMLGPPDSGMAPPMFTPTFISSHLVTSIDPTAPLSHERKKGNESDRGYSMQGNNNSMHRGMNNDFVNPQHVQYERGNGFIQRNEESEGIRGGGEGGGGGGSFDFGKHGRMEGNDNNIQSTDNEYEKNQRPRLERKEEK